jgi:hypothetical protein
MGAELPMVEVAPRIVRPKGARNFIRTIPNNGWNAIFRLYGPLEPWFEKAWRLGDIEPFR